MFLVGLQLKGEEKVANFMFSYGYTVRFRDTDAAGVVYFANLLAICHEAYEASLTASGIEARSFFSGRSIAVPIVAANIQFFHPACCGDRLQITLTPTAIEDSEFAIAYNIYTDDETHLAAATTRHVCIDPAVRRRHPLPDGLKHWLQQWGTRDREMPSS